MYPYAHTAHLLPAACSQVSVKPKSKLLKGIAEEYINQHRPEQEDDEQEEGAGEDTVAAGADEEGQQQAEGGADTAEADEADDDEGIKQDKPAEEEEAVAGVKEQEQVSWGSQEVGEGARGARGGGGARGVVHLHNCSSFV